jgi:hypothetical protein
MRHVRLSRLAVLSLAGALLAACGGAPAAAGTASGASGTGGGETAAREGAAEGEDEEFPLDPPTGVPGTGVTLRPPRGSDVLPTGAGFVHTRRRIQILVAETEGPASLLASFREQLLAGAEAEGEPETITLSGIEATLGVDRQESGEVELERVWLYAEDGRRAVAVIGAYVSDRSERYRGLVRAALTSAAWDRARPIDPEQALGFGLTVEGLELDRSSSSPLVYALAGAAVPPSPAEPRLFVMSLPVAVPASQRSEVCEALLLQAGPVGEDTVQDRHDIETDELEGCEVEGLQENEEPDEGEPESATTYAAVLFHDDGVFLVAGIVDAALRETWIGRFREAARTLHRVRTDDEASEE